MCLIDIQYPELWLNKNQITKLNRIQFKWVQRDSHQQSLSSLTNTHPFGQIPPVSSIHFLDIQANIKCRFTLIRVHDMIRTYNQMHRTDKYSQLSSIIWSLWPTRWLFVYELSGCVFNSCCTLLNFRSRLCFDQEFPWHSGKYRA